MSYLEKFLPTEKDKLFFPFMAAFFIAGFGVALGFIAAHWSIRWLSVTAYLITLASVLFCLASFVRIFFKLIFGLSKSDTNKKEH
jgi:glucan phosphoethanolaminetransferase (alkaline phosphatase superfamily)